jgi:hypothetical protein
MLHLSCSTSCSWRNCNFKSLLGNGDGLVVTDDIKRYFFFFVEEQIGSVKSVSRLSSSIKSAHYKWLYVYTMICLLDDGLCI